MTHIFAYDIPAALSSIPSDVLRAAGESLVTRNIEHTAFLALTGQLDGLSIVNTRSRAFRGITGTQQFILTPRSVAVEAESDYSDVSTPWGGPTSGMFITLGGGLFLNKVNCKVLVPEGECIGTLYCFRNGLNEQISNTSFITWELRVSGELRWKKMRMSKTSVGTSSEGNQGNVLEEGVNSGRKGDEERVQNVVRDVQVTANPQVQRAESSDYSIVHEPRTSTGKRPLPEDLIISRPTIPPRPVDGDV